MDVNLLPLLLAAIVGLLIGFLSAYLLASRKTSESNAQKVYFETKSIELDKQRSALQDQIRSLAEEDGRKQRALLDAERTTAVAETGLKETQEIVNRIGQELESLKVELNSEREQATLLRESNAELVAKYDASLRSIEEQREFLQKANESLREAFDSLSSSALRQNSSSFIELAKESLDSRITESKADLDARQRAIDTLVKPLSETLTSFQEKVQEIEVKREGAYSEMRTLLDVMKLSTDQLNAGTTNLVTALKTSYVRGRYGEIGLRRLVEAAGMSEYCDFTEQATVNTDDGRLIPDMRIDLPGQRQLILDSKVPLISYMQAFETTVESERMDLLAKHSRDVREHLRRLSNKSYWEQFSETPDFVIMYMQIESSFGAALMQDHGLIEDGINKKVVLATPSTLITMLRTVGFVWQQERLAKSIYDMRDAGVELFKRTTNMLEHFSGVGTGLTRAVNAYNSAVGSLESRFLPHIAKIKDIGGTLANKDMPNLKPVALTVRPLNKETSDDENPPMQGDVEAVD